MLFNYPVFLYVRELIHRMKIAEPMTRHCVLLLLTAGRHIRQPDRAERMVNSPRFSKVHWQAHLAFSPLA